jgi:CRISPR-associated protein Csb1
MSLSVVRDAVCGTAAAFRCVTKYQPTGGEGDKVFPPTYEGGKYATEQRRVPGFDQPVPCVLLDSVQSQANRMELALLDAWERDRIPLPVLTVDFGGFDLPKPLRITSLEAPHRIADALLRDSLLDKKPFRESAVGMELDRVDARNATALFRYCPTTLIFGMWDSTGPKGGLGAKFARAMVSELVGYWAVVGVKTSSRIDPAQIMLQAGPLYKAMDGGWTLDETKAAKEKGKPVKLGKDGKPSEANHGNVKPTLEDGKGGVTLANAVQTTVLSLAALRRLRFPIDGESKSDQNRDDAARTVLATLALCAAALAQESGCDLRSRCQLHPAENVFWQLLDKPGENPVEFTLQADTAIDMYREAVAAAKKAKLPWLDEEIVLQPSPQLVELVRRSQALAAGAGEVPV